MKLFPEKSTSGDAMTITQPLSCVEYTATEVSRYKDDVALWNQNKQVVEYDRWISKDLVSKAKHLFDQLIDLDLAVQEFILVEHGNDDVGLTDRVRTFLRDWLTSSLQLILHIRRPSPSDSELEGLDRLLVCIEDAKSMLTPDEQFFDSAELVNLRDEAIDDHRAALTEPLFDNETVA
jgi:hypothetical protein